MYDYIAVVPILQKLALRRVKGKLRVLNQSNQFILWQKENHNKNQPRLLQK